MSTETCSSPSEAATDAAFATSHRPSAARRAVWGVLAGMKQGQLHLELPDGTTAEFGTPGSTQGPRLPLGLSARAIIHVRREAFFKKCLWSGDIGFGESYMDGDWETPDLAAVIAWFILNLENAPGLSGSRRARVLAQNILHLVNRLGHVLRPNTHATARRNIAEHYDLSNDFFSLWLDPSMMYSAAKWPVQAPDGSLAEAQWEKNDALCRSLRLTPADHVLEIGTGWGGWSLHAARTYGSRVTTVTISQRQFEFARHRVVAAGLADRIEVRLQDYRELSGSFDKIVSIEMMEALGHRYLRGFCQVLNRVLRPDGLLALQFITCPDARYHGFRRGVDFIQKHIFPGSLLLSLNRVNDQLSHAGGFVLHQVTDLGHDYARTLHVWRDNFTGRQPEVRALGFDDRFIRKWHYYLCYCEAAFTMRNISVVQTLHTRANNLAL